MTLPTRILPETEPGYLVICVPKEEYENMKSELERCKKKCGSLIQHLIRAREKGYYDFENVDYGGEK
jgi:hypothetical protein